MFKKSRQIADSTVLLRIVPPRPWLNYLQICILMAAFAVFTILVFGVADSFTREPSLLVPLMVVYLLLAALITTMFFRLKPTPLVFTEKGISDSLFFSVNWDEVEAYDFVRGLSPGKNRVLILWSNRPPFYNFRFFTLPRYMSEKGYFFTEATMEDAARIFAARNVLRVQRNF